MPPQGFTECDAPYLASSFPPFAPVVIFRLPPPWAGHEFYTLCSVRLASLADVFEVLVSRATRNRRDPLATPFAASPAASKPHAPILSSLLKDRPKLLASVEKSSRAVRSFESTEALRRMWCARETWAEDRYELLLDEGDVKAAVNVLTSSDLGSFGPVTPE
ncbi:hypothetical protein L198_07849 [Cryptococcus wingfieldii CBS 7118]|uniref:Uncharacterized protein n=1 Tax=Cryptococcus wingfieldii CBS 7118 TaxID=1295528 RepID=A0A1E3HV20_9TREE|nr:hypothetical protein L198_07849 [Cryptococcus wingfieldii CBS 7118]ODN80192.1 hypothetical protein L198_07849 [Cryptococcus wingfieldii CBS 7118]